MKKILLVLLLFMLNTGFLQAAEVVQGQCVDYDGHNEQLRIIVLKSTDTNKNRYEGPRNDVRVFNTAQAMMSKEPEVGDILRISFYIRDSEKVALKIMNITKQNSLKK